jgi:Viral coat protein P2 N-terminal domain
MFYDDMIDFQNCTPGNTGILKLSYNATFDKLHLKLSGGLTKAHLGKIEGKANGVTFFEDSVPNIAVRDSFLGVFTQADTVTIDFTEPNTKGGAAAQYLAALPRNLLNSLTFEVEILPAAPVGMKLKCEGEYRDPTQNPFILRRKKFAIPLGVTGDNDYTLPSGKDGGLIKRVWIHHAGIIQAAELRTNGTPRVRATVASMEYKQKRNRVVPQANLFVLDFIDDGNLMNMLNTTNVTETMLRLNTTGTGQATVYLDYVDDLRKLH